MKFQFALWRLCASVTCFAIALGLGRLAYTLPQTSTLAAFSSILAAILCVVFVAGGIGVLFRCGLSVALTTLQIIGNFIP